MVSRLRKNIKNIKGIALCCQIKKYNHLLYESHDDNVIGNGDDVEKIGDLEKQEWQIDTNERETQLQWCYSGFCIIKIGWIDLGRMWDSCGYIFWNYTWYLNIWIFVSSSRQLLAFGMWNLKMPKTVPSVSQPQSSWHPSLCHHTYAENIKLMMSIKKAVLLSPQLLAVNQAIMSV